MPAPTRVSAIRGAVDVSADTPAEIRAAVAELVRQVSSRNQLQPDGIISAQFTMTPDLRSVFPASAAREAGWTSVPMMCACAVDVPGALARCIRILVHANVSEGQRVEHVYLGNAVSLRPDLRTPDAGD